MIDIINNIDFNYPIAFLIILIYFFIKYFMKEKNEQLLFPNIEIFKQVGKNRNYIKILLEFLTILFLTLALSSPYTQDDIVIQKNKGYELSMILDSSGSMQQYNKFKIVKDIIINFINTREHDKLGLTIFADFSYIAIPLTYDKKSIKRLLEKIEVGVAGRKRTALYEALFMSSKLFKDSKSKEKIAILLTDGVNNVDTIPLDVAIRTAKKYGIRVYSIGVGNRGDYNPADLRRMSEETGGKFFEANSIEKLKKIYEDINILEKSEIEINKFIKKSYYFQYPLSIALLLIFIYFIYRGRV